ncbi:MAG: hypothetical protein JW744_04425, partial [Candidatus Diapherotrites archaeon]|nr:hypothetical protein [Candidatus Diapherotrites archaeon]
DGLARDPYDLRKKWILPQSFVDSLLRDAIRRKLLPKMLEDRALIPLTELAREVGFAERSLHGRKDLETVKIGGKRFVARKEAERFKLRFPVGRKMTLVEEVKLFQRTAYDELKKLGDERIPIEQRRQLKAKLEKQMEEFDKRLETERAKAMLKKGPTKPDFFERNNLDIARARLEILSGLAEGRTVKDRAIKSLMKRIQELQELNEALSH